MNVRLKKSSNVASSLPLTRVTLTRLKLKAIRKGCWFKALKRNERMLLNLTISVVQRVRSFLLARAVSRLVSKLNEALESKIFRLMRTQGQKMAENFSKIAQNWGYRAAKSWVNDKGFVQYLTINNILSLSAKT